jgi:hypothetical protein
MSGMLFNSTSPTLTIPIKGLSSICEVNVQADYVGHL